jgi:hypothetical protein
MGERLNHWNKSKLIHRLLIFLISMIIIITSCMLHGIYAGVKTTEMIDQMLKTGNLTGKFWQIIEVQPDQITVTKYKKKVILICSLPDPIKKGDRVSFNAVSKTHPDSNSDPLWHPVKIKIHGKSTFKFGLSFISVIMVMVMCFRFIRFDNKTAGLLFREEKN